MQTFTADLPIYKEPSKRFSNFLEDFVTNSKYLVQFVGDRVVFTQNGISNISVKKSSMSTSIMVNSLKDPFTTLLNLEVLRNFLIKFNIMSSMACIYCSDCKFTLSLIAGDESYPNSVKLLHATLETEDDRIYQTVDNLFGALN